MAGYKSSYLHIGELVDQFFPPIRQVSSISSYWNNAQWNDYMQNHRTPSPLDLQGHQGHQGVLWKILNG